MSLREALQSLRGLRSRRRSRVVTTGLAPLPARVSRCFDEGGTGLLIWPARTAYTKRAVGHLAATPEGRATLCGVRIPRYALWDDDFLDRAEARHRVSCIRCARMLKAGLVDS
jgi:hypothetical protein